MLLSQLLLLNVGAAAALRPTCIGRAALLHPSAASNCISSQTADISRRAALLITAPVLAAGVLLLRPEGAGASYAMTQAASTTVAFEHRQATPKELERAVYEEIEASIDEKRPGRPDEGTLGYVGGEYTKRSAHKRLEYDASINTVEAKAASGAPVRDRMLGAMIDAM